MILKCIHNSTDPLTCKSCTRIREQRDRLLETVAVSRLESRECRMCLEPFFPSDLRQRYCAEHRNGAVLRPMLKRYCRICRTGFQTQTPTRRLCDTHCRSYTVVHPKAPRLTYRGARFQPEEDSEA